MNVWNYLEKHDLTDTVCEGLDRLNFNSERVDDVMDAMGRFMLVINYRAKSRFGQFSPRKRSIELTSEYFNGDWDERKADHHNTMLHEVAHLVVHIVHKKSADRIDFRAHKIQSHGREWQSVMRAFGLEPKRCGTSNVLADARLAKKRPHKHLYTCIECGHEHGTQRELKNLERRYHAKCGGKFIYQRVA